jgi:hypothetical protein
VAECFINLYHLRGIQGALLKAQDPAEKEMLSMQTKIPRVKRLVIYFQHSHKATSLEEEKVTYNAFDLKTTVV